MAQAPAALQQLMLPVTLCVASLCDSACLMQGLSGDDGLAHCFDGMYEPKVKTVTGTSCGESVAAAQLRNMLLHDREEL